MQWLNRRRFPTTWRCRLGLARDAAVSVILETPKRHVAHIIGWVRGYHSNARTLLNHRVKALLPSVAKPPKRAEAYAFTALRVPFGEPR